MVWSLYSSLLAFRYGTCVPDGLVLVPEDCSEVQGDCVSLRSGTDLARNTWGPAVRKVENLTSATTVHAWFVLQVRTSDWLDRSHPMVLEGVAYTRWNASSGFPSGSERNGSLLSAKVRLPTICLRTERDKGQALWSMLQSVVLVLGRFGRSIPAGLSLEAAVEHLPPWSMYFPRLNQPEAELFPLDFTSKFGRLAPPEDLPDDCGIELAIPLSHPLPPLLSIGECLAMRIPGDSTTCGWWRDIRVRRQHTSWRCFSDSYRKVIVWKQDHKDFKHKTLKFVHDCVKQGWRTFWAVRFEGCRNDGRCSVKAENIIEKIVLCVPAACCADDVAAWIIPAILHAQTATKFKFSDTVKGASCEHLRNGSVRLPQREGLPGTSFDVVYKLHGERARHVYIMGSQLGNMMVLLAHQSILARYGIPRYVPRTYGVAMVFASDYRINLPILENIRSYVWKPLNVSAVFAVISGSSAVRVDVGLVQHQVFSESFGLSLKRFVWWPRDMDIEGLETELADNGNLDIYACSSGWAFTPLSSRVGGSIHSYRKIGAVYNLLRNYEESALRGRFGWIIFTRSDLIWRFEHPAIGFLRENVLWTVQGEDWHVVTPRNLACAFFCRWDYLRSGQLPPFQVNPPSLLRIMRIFLSVAEGELPRVACLSACPTGTCYTLNTSKRGGYRYGSCKSKLERIQVDLRRGGSWAVASRSRLEYYSGLLEEGYTLPLIAPSKSNVTARFDFVEKQFSPTRN